MEIGCILLNWLVKNWQSALIDNLQSFLVCGKMGLG